MNFTDWQAPDFTLRNTAGEQITLSDYRGKPVALILMAVHCSHSMDTLPIISKLKKKHEPLGLVILPVYVNAVSAQNLSTWTSALNLDYPLIASPDKGLAQKYKTWLTPTTFLIDREGKITKKFVGYKDKATLDAAFEEFNITTEEIR